MKKTLLAVLLMAALMFGLVLLITRQQGGSNSQMLNFGKSVVDNGWGMFVTLG